MGSEMCIRDRGTSVSVQIRVPMFFFKHTLEVTSTSKYDNSQEKRFGYQHCCIPVPGTWCAGIAGTGIPVCARVVGRVAQTVGVLGGIVPACCISHAMYHELLMDRYEVGVSTAIPAASIVE